MTIHLTVQSGSVGVRGTTYCVETDRETYIAIDGKIKTDTSSSRKLEEAVRVRQDNLSHPPTTTSLLLNCDQRPLLYPLQPPTLPTMSEPVNLASSLHLARPPFRWWVSDHLSSASDPSTVSMAPPESPGLEFIKFLHPAYDSPGNILFTLPAVDSTVLGESKGVHHGVALTACRIIAGNAPGFLSTSPVQLSAENTLSFDHVLTAPQYFFHLTTTNGDTSTPYPICPEFRSWAFPHDCLPTEWSPDVDVCNLLFSLILILIGENF